MISIIMPLYNAECFLLETLQSIENQTLTDYELICIDDCSTDSTIEIVIKAMKTDKRIRLLHNEVRRGAAISRNRGIEEAKGEYLTFLDGDDIFEEEMLETAYRCAKQNKLDIVVYEFLSVLSDNVHIKRKIDRSNAYRRMFCEKAFRLHDIKPLDYVQWSYGPCNKLYNTKFIRKYALQFQALSSCNDVYFVEMAYMLAERIMFLDDERVMIYVREHSTSSRISVNRDPMCAYAACKKIVESLTKLRIDSQLFQYSYLRIYHIFLNAILYIKEEEKRKEFYEFLHNKGVMELIKNGESSLKDCLANDHTYLSQFLEREYETKWFENESVVSTILRTAESNIWDLWRQYKNISIWGAGTYGKSLLKLISERNLNICCVIDQNSKIAGMQIERYVVQCPQEVTFRNIDLVIVATKVGYNGVKEQLKQYNVDVVDIKDYL